MFLYGGQGEDQLCKDAFWVQDGGGWGIELHVSLLVSASVCMLLIQVIIGSCHPDLLPHSHTHTHSLSLSHCTISLLAAATWEEVEAEGKAPGARMGHSCVYDAVRAVAVCV